jgi:hypothetical protein
MDPTSKDLINDWLDLPPSDGGAGLNSLSRSADEEFLGSFAAIAALLTSFCRKTKLLIYIRIAEVLERLGDNDDLLEEAIPLSPKHPCVPLEAIRFVSERASASTYPPTEDELTLATHIIKGHSIVKVPGKWNTNGDAAPASIVLP